MTARTKFVWVAALAVGSWARGGHALETARAVSSAEAAAAVQRLLPVVNACAAEANSCDASSVGPDLRVGDPATGGYALHFAWLRDALQAARSAKAEDRRESMKEAAEHLNAVAGTPSTTRDGSFAGAKTAVSSVLARDEFSEVESPSWWERQKARFWSFVGRLFGMLFEEGSANPWVGRLLEWLLFLLAAAGLGLLLMRSLSRQRMQVSLAQDGAAAGWARESTAWAALAEKRAADGEWREAVHCLYWASIVLLEGRRAWRRDSSRTPREYVRLLQTGTVQRDALTTLTSLLERTWYGLREAKAEDYARARSAFAVIETGRGDGPVAAAVADGAA